jgi:hypothetical protein
MGDSIEVNEKWESAKGAAWKHFKSSTRLGQALMSYRRVFLKCFKSTA